MFRNHARSSLLLDFIRSPSTRPLFKASSDHSSLSIAAAASSSKQPKFLAELERQKEQRHVCFRFPSVLNVEEFCSAISKFSREATEGKPGQLSPRQKERSKVFEMERQQSPVAVAPSDIAEIDYLTAAKVLSSSLTPSAIRSYLRHTKVFDPTREREPLIPYESARQLILSHLPQHDTTMRRYFEEHDLQYVEFDKFAQPKLFLPNTGPHTDCSNAALLRRTPVVALMGHIDHGKTTLLDCLQGSNLVKTEPGAITQTVRAFTVQVAVNPQNNSSSSISSDADVSASSATTVANSTAMMTFVDTPGHRIFAEIRLSGSRISDIILLLIALDEGVKGQTEEIVRTAIQYEKPLLVVLSKVDLYSGNAKMLSKRIAQIQEDLARLGIKVTFLQEANLFNSSSNNNNILQRTVDSMRDKWYRFDHVVSPAKLGQVKLDASGKVPDPAPGKVLRACIGICISAKFNFNIDVLVQLIHTATSHGSFPRASQTATPTQARVLESFRDYGAERAASMQQRATPTSVSTGPSSGGTAFSSAPRREAPVNIVAILRNGNLRVGMPFVCDQGWGVVEQVKNTWGDLLLSGSLPSFFSGSASAPSFATSQSMLERKQQLRPGSAVVIVGSCDTTCPGAGTHLIECHTAQEAEHTSKFRNRLRFFIERHPELVHMLRPKDKQSKFLHVGNAGQTEEADGSTSSSSSSSIGDAAAKDMNKLLDSNYEYRLLYKEAKMPEVDESPLELQWRASQLPPEQQPKTMAEYSEYIKNHCRVINVLVKVDNWNSARATGREIPRLGTKNVALNIIGAGFGPVNEQELQKFGANLNMIVVYRAPRLQNPHIEFALKARGVHYGEFDVYTDMLEWIKGKVLEAQQQESEKRSTEQQASKRAGDSMLRAAGFGKGAQRGKGRTSQQLTPANRS